MSVIWCSPPLGHKIKAAKVIAGIREVSVSAEKDVGKLWSTPKLLSQVVALHKQAYF